MPRASGDRRGIAYCKRINNKSYGMNGVSLSYVDMIFDCSNNALVASAGRGEDEGSIRSLKNSTAHRAKFPNSDTSVNTSSCIFLLGGSPV